MGIVRSSAGTLHGAVKPLARGLLCGIVFLAISTRQHKSAKAWTAVILWACIKGDLMSPNPIRVASAARSGIERVGALGFVGTVYACYRHEAALRSANHVCAQITPDAAGTAFEFYRIPFSSEMFAVSDRTFAAGLQMREHS